MPSGSAAADAALGSLMRSLAVFGGGALPTLHASTRIDGVPTRACIVGAAAPYFDADVDRDRVLVRVRAFSCNYRDRTFLYRLRSAPQDRFFVLGSEFCGEVVAVGRDVLGLGVGDRVLTDHHYTGASASSGQVPEGVVTNQASKELQVVSSWQLQRVPECMPETPPDRAPRWRCWRGSPEKTWRS
jgi:hypothetical protein